MIRHAILIDDEKVDQRLYKRVIDRCGLIEELTMFSYADEALAHLKAHPDLQVDVIFLDINMPRMNGFEFLEAAQCDLGDRFARITVAMLSTSLSPQDQVRARAYGSVKTYIGKPLTVEDLIEVDALAAA